MIIISRSRRVILSAAIALAASAGCGSGPYETVPVEGTVMCDGKPAWGGTVIFQPLDSPDDTDRPSGSPGRAASGLIQEDGSFRLTVPAAGGARDAIGTVVGPHRVSFVLPKTTPWEMDPEDLELPPEEQEEIKAHLAQQPVYEELPCSGTITPSQVEVKPGENRFEFTLESR